MAKLEKWVYFMKSVKVMVERYYSHSKATVVKYGYGRTGLENN